MENILRLAAAEHTFNLRYNLQFTWQTLFIGLGQTSAALLSSDTQPLDIE